VLVAARRALRSWLTSAPVRTLGSTALAQRRGLCSCLLYHRVHANGRSDAEWGNGILSVSLDDFDRQIGWLARNRRCLALDEALALLRDARLPAGSAVVTFDDGYRDNLELALPVLEKHGVPATIFVATGLIEAAVEPWWVELEALIARLDQIEVGPPGEGASAPLRTDAQRNRAYDRLASRARMTPPAEIDRMLEPMRAQAARPARPAPELMLSWDEIGRLAQHPMVTIGAHTVSHPPLTALAPEDARREIEESRSALEARAGVSAAHFAYPYGSAAHAGAREADLVAAAGFRGAYTAVEGHWVAADAARPFLLPRIAITRRDGLDGVRFKLSGWHAPVTRAAR